MAHKIHFLATKQGSAACAVGTPTADGKIYKNRRDTYATIPASHIVSNDEFRATAPDDRCAHCAAKFTDLINSRRMKSGKPLYRDAFTKTLA